MVTNEQAESPCILETVDTFMAAVPWGDNRTVLLYRREHGGRTYLRLRTWNRHRERGVWYPTTRGFVIPKVYGKGLLFALDDALAGLPDQKPDWLAARETAEESLLRSLTGAEIPDDPAARTAMLARLRRERQ